MVKTVTGSGMVAEHADVAALGMYMRALPMTETTITATAPNGREIKAWRSKAADDNGAWVTERNGVVVIMA